MNKQEALKVMKSPQDKRNVWRQGVLQIWITRACDKACFSCTQGSNLGGKPGMITPAQFEVAVKSLMEPTRYFGVVGMFGGNPTMHPKFDELCEILRTYVPFEQRGLWCNNPRGKGATARITFNPKVSNLNVHMDRGAYDEFARDWPECRSVLKGLTSDSRHSPPFVAMQDITVEADAIVTGGSSGNVITPGKSMERRRLTEDEIWTLTGTCDVNQHWSSMICVFRDELRAYFCELAGAQAMLHQHDPTYPDTGKAVTPGWWNQPMSVFADQADYHCRRCGIPLRGYGDLAITGTHEQVSETHKDIYIPKTKDRLVELVTSTEQLKMGVLPKATDYVENGGNFK